VELVGIKEQGKKGEKEIENMSQLDYKTVFSDAGHYVKTRRRKELLKEFTNRL